MSIPTDKFASGNFFVCACVFFGNKKYIFSCKFDLLKRVSDKKNSAGRFPEKTLLFFWRHLSFLDMDDLYILQ